MKLAEGRARGESLSFRRANAASSEAMPSGVAVSRGSRTYAATPRFWMNSAIVILRPVDANTGHR